MRDLHYGYLGHDDFIFRVIGKLIYAASRNPVSDFDQSLSMVSRDVKHRVLRYTLTDATCRPVVVFRNE